MNVGDFSSLTEMIGNSETFTTFDQCVTARQRSEFHVEIDERTEQFLYAVGASFTPAFHFYGSEIPAKIYEEITQLPTIEEVMIFLSQKAPGKYHDVVEYYIKNGTIDGCTMLPSTKFLYLSSKKNLDRINNIHALETVSYTHLTLPTKA